MKDISSTAGLLFDNQTNFSGIFQIHGAGSRNFLKYKASLIRQRSDDQNSQQRPHTSINEKIRKLNSRDDLNCSFSVVSYLIYNIRKFHSDKWSAHVIFTE